MLSKASQLPADVLVPDLEDSVPDSEKQQARNMLRAMIPSLAQHGQTIIPRVNALDTGLAQDDMAAIVCHQVYAVTIGKIKSPWDILQLSTILDGLEFRAQLPNGSIRLIPWIENSSAIVHAHQIATSSGRIIALAFGAEDFAHDMSVQRSGSGSEIAYPRAVVAMAAQAAGLLAIDTPCVDFQNVEGLKQEIRSVIPLGFKGKFAIHPGQLETINTMFSPSLEEIEYAKQVIAVFEEAEAIGSGATSLDGKMIDIPVVKRARNILLRAGETAHREGYRQH